MKKLLVLSVLLFSVSASAGEKYDCTAEKENITKDLMKPVECVHDDECTYFDYGYPWQPAECMKAIVSSKKEPHNISNLELIEEYNQNCVYKDPKEKKKYDDFSQKLDKAECDHIPRAYCYKGFCRIQGYATYNDE